MTSPWPAEAIQSIRGEGERFRHVAKHLYRVNEHWEQVASALGEARDRARGADCPARVLGTEWPDVERVPPSCRAHVLRDHDERFSPAYLRELHAAVDAGRCGALPPEPGRPRGAMYVGDAGVTLIVREPVAEPPRVYTAYRGIPRHGTTRADFFKEAVRKLADKTSWRVSE